MGSYSYSRTAKMIVQQMDLRNPIYITAYQKAVEFFAVYDVIEQTNHAEIIKSIFGEGANRRKTIDGVAMERYCTSRTLYRYEQKYVDCIMLYVRIETKEFGLT